MEDSRIGQEGLAVQGQAYVPEVIEDSPAPSGVPSALAF
jgi:hypothetical protein